ncbi:MAG: non-ribosomal peptide synthetase, partial [Gammaproteobacteria bacterium]
DIFEGSSIKRFFNHFEILINEILKDPARLIDEISILTPEENQKILIDWNDTQVPYSKDQTVYQLFEAQAAKTPNNIAIVFEDQEFTYQQLNEKSNKLARYLRSLGVGSETLVAIAIESSLEMIIGLLGVLKAGGAYVPLDLTYPEERLSFLLEDTNAKILLTQPSLAERFKNYQGELCSLTYNAAKKSVCVASLLFDNSFNNKFSQITQDISLESYTSDNLPSFTTPQHLAYVIYTSGSTGKPKGVGIQHGSLTQYLQYGIKYLAAPGIGKSLLHSSIAFDMSITTIFISLVKGNILAILPTDATGIEPLIDYLKQSPDLNFLKITPSHLKALKNQLNPQDIMRHNISLIMGGEVLLKEDIANWIPTADTAFVINHYGPTEATVGCCVFVLNDIEKINTPCVPIGKPISNTQIYILDNQLNPVPVNVPGEIYIGGDGLARGYLNRPDLTAEKFVPNHFMKLENHKETKQLRLYRTGDLARYLSDGNIEFLGRIDDQVKIRGFRIECKEIESILNTHGDVTATVVLARNDDNSHKKLVAYIVPGDFTPSSSELREYLEE